MQSLTFLVAVFFLFQAIHCFCVYNKFEEGGYFSITDARGDIRSDKIFRQELQPGDVSCCHFSNRDCSPNGKDDDVNSFHLYITLPRFKTTSKRMLAHCTTGGALVLYGKDEQIFADCKFANGTISLLDLTVDEMNPYDINALAN